MQLVGWTRKAFWGAGLGLVLSLASFAARPALAADPTDEATDPVKRGAYLFIAGNCMDCHTNAKEGGAPLAGGLPLTAEVLGISGTFYTPNISPDKEFGIGNWTDADFINAFRNGVSPTGSYY